MSIKTLIYISLLGCFWIACQQSSSSTKTVNQQSGESLAKSYCGACHQYPAPTILDQTTWKQYVLPRMGYMMGIFPDSIDRLSLIEEGLAGEKVENAKVFPQKAILTNEEWKQIEAFYLSQAPEKLATPISTPIQQQLDLFKIKKAPVSPSIPGTTLVRFTQNGYFIGDAQQKSIHQFDKNGKLIGEMTVGEGSISISGSSRALLLTLMGSFSPTDFPGGKILSIPPSFDKAPKVLIDGLQRPVHTSYGDLNADGRLDVVTCEFGKWTGSLSWWELPAGQPAVRHPLRQAPGATKAYIRDLNGDQLPDIIALFAQGDEGIFIFYNEGGGNFRQERILRFQPSYGSSFFKLVDWDNDGFEDILYTAGDNADYAPVLKPYHGIYIFRNNGKNQFKQHLFIPLHGAYAALAEDFDSDGDNDIAAISFFPDFSDEKHSSFVFYENNGEEHFTAYTFPENQIGRWLVMDAGDPDQDGDIDLILGSLAFEVVDDQFGYLKNWIKNGPPYVILENKTID